MFSFCFSYWPTLLTRVRNKITLSYISLGIFDEELYVMMSLVFAHALSLMFFQNRNSKWLLWCQILLCFYSIVAMRLLSFPRLPNPWVRKNFFLRWAQHFLFCLIMASLWEMYGFFSTLKMMLLMICFLKFCFYFAFNKLAL